MSVEVKVGSGGGVSVDVKGQVIFRGGNGSGATADQVRQINQNSSDIKQVSDAVNQNAKAINDHHIEYQTLKKQVDDMERGDSTEIQNASVTTQKIADKAVTKDKLADDVVSLLGSSSSATNLPLPMLQFKKYVYQSGEYKVFDSGYDGTAAVSQGNDNNPIVMKSAMEKYVQDTLANAGSSTGIATASLTDALAYLEKDSELISLPSYAKENLDSIEQNMARFDNPNVFNFAFITDLHVTEASAYTRLHRRIVKTINELTKNHNISLVVLGGDYLSNSKQTTKEAVTTFYNHLDDAYKGCNAPVFVVNGNHDNNSSSTESAKYLSHAERNMLFGRRWFSNFHLGDMDMAYGYADYPNYKIRFVFLDNTDVGTYVDNEGVVQNPSQNLFGYSTKQLKFVIDALKGAASNGYGVIFASHAPIESHFISNLADMSGIVRAFQNAEKYSSDAITADFTGYPKGSIILGIAGHYHDDSIALDGYAKIRTGAATLIDQSRTFETKEETIFDLVSVDLDNQMVEMSRKV